MFIGKIRRIAVLVAATALLAVPAALAFAHGGEDHSAISPEEPAILMTKSGQPVPVESEIDFCPTLEQSTLHWETYGFDYKPTVPCGDAANMDTPAINEIPAQPPLPEVNSLAGAQALLDPEDDPQVLVGVDPNTGKYISVSVTTRQPIPSYVKSFEQFREWAKIDTKRYR